MTCCGSVTKAKLRMADSTTVILIKGLDSTWVQNVKPILSVSCFDMAGLLLKFVYIKISLHIGVHNQEYVFKILNLFSQIKELTGHFEIVSLVGTLSGGESGHLHISLSDPEGHVIGGHVVGDLIVYTTAEVVIGDCTGAKFQREDDLETGYDELVIYRK